MNGLAAAETHPVHVLVVEDNEVDAKLVRLSLLGVSAWDVDFERVGDGEEAVRYLRHQGLYASKVHPDLVVLDLNLPKLDGTEVLRTIRRDPELRNLKVIVLSSSPMDVIEEKVRDSEVQPDCYFTKPLGLDEFLALGATMHRCYLESGGDNQTLGAGV